jgi:uncharacterized protein (TIGR02118 family)
MSSPEQPILLFGLYRWSGTTPEEFRKHYLTRHGPEIGGAIPGVAWYRVYLNKDPQTELGAPRADAFAIVCFESQQAAGEAANTPEWAAAIADFDGFVGHLDSYSVEQVFFGPGS